MGDAGLGSPWSGLGSLPATVQGMEIMFCSGFRIQPHPSMAVFGASAWICSLYKARRDGSSLRVVVGSEGCQ